MIYVFHKGIRTIMSKLQDFTTRMNKGEINTGESNENENVHKFFKEQANILP
jgi:hypothetical protein